jgi:hypothetical protein
MDTSRAGRNAEQVSLRLPVGLRSQIKERAARNFRSINSEIIFHLQQAMLNPDENEKADAQRA